MAVMKRNRRGHQEDTASPQTSSIVARAHASPLDSHGGVQPCRREWTWWLQQHGVAYCGVPFQRVLRGDETAEHWRCSLRGVGCRADAVRDRRPGVVHIAGRDRRYGSSSWTLVHTPQLVAPAYSVSKCVANVSHCVERPCGF